jgi:LysM repeat protein
MLNQKLVIPIEDRAHSEKSEKIDSTFYYMVQEGDTLASISKEYRVSIENLMLQNNLDGSIIKTGERLKVNE